MKDLKIAFRKDEDYHSRVYLNGKSTELVVIKSGNGAPIHAAWSLLLSSCGVVLNAYDYKELERKARTMLSIGSLATQGRDTFGDLPDKLTRKESWMP